MVVINTNMKNINLRKNVKKRFKKYRNPYYSKKKKYKKRYNKYIDKSEWKCYICKEKWHLVLYLLEISDSEIIYDMTSNKSESD